MRVVLFAFFESTCVAEDPWPAPVGRDTVVQKSLGKGKVSNALLWWCPSVLQHQRRTQASWLHLPY